MSEILIEGVVSFLILVGSFFTLAGSVAMVRFGDFFLRLHGPTKATTLGVGALLLATTVYFSWHEDQVRFQELLIMLFLFITTPVSAYLLAKAALHIGVDRQTELPQERRRSDTGSAPSANENRREDQ